VQYAKQTIHDTRFEMIHAPFSQLNRLIRDRGLAGKIQGILFDLGVSSPQLDDPTRGFSFSREGVLDMRMDVSTGVDAMTWLLNVDEKTLARILWEYGEERFSRQIAKRIVTERQMTPITTTKQLADIIKLAIPARYRTTDKHPATKSFQAIRIAVNHELEELETVLPHVLDMLAIGGRFAVISFHSLEDRIVKTFIRTYEKGETLPRGLPIKSTHFQARLKSIGKRIQPTQDEILTNPRARSAILRVAEKIS
jgi:16S rRNA (cytosine1402-N4)-methyltransferase